MYDTNDMLAVTHAVSRLRDLVGHQEAEAIVGEHTVNFERMGGLRRLVLVGEWEVDPSAVAARANGGT
jgi:hypothetical protein